MDFKGHFRVGSGQRCQPLTVRDEYSRYLLVVEHQDALSEELVRARTLLAFRRYGRPKAIRVDNGAPFGGRGALGLTRLSVWWHRLGIEVQFIRRAKPQDNGAHEQMHKVLKAETARPAAASLAAQQRRLDRWRRLYNEQRPHESLDDCSPAQIYRHSRRRYRGDPPAGARVPG